jgi:putative ABC transport system permease protein
MLKNFLKITFRNFLKNRLFVSINVLGLGIALACCIVAYLNWDFNIQFDTQHVNASKIYRINFMRITNGQSVGNGSCPMPLGEIVSGNFSQVDKVARVFPSGGNFKVDDELFRTAIGMVDPDFFRMFTFEMIHGNADGIEDKTKILISDELAGKYFADVEDPTGQMITYIIGEERLDNQGLDRLEYMVAGVFKKPPMNSSFNFLEAYVHFDNVFGIQDWERNDWSLFNSTFVWIDDPDNIADVELQMQEYVEIQNRAKEDYKVARYYLDPFKGMAIRAEREDLWNHWFNQSLPSAAAVAPGIMAILLLLLACFNFTNTTIAIANRRLKEIGLRKVMGSYREQLILQFLGENVILAFFGLLLGLLLAHFLVPAYSSLWPFLEISMNYRENLGFFGFLLVLLIGTGIVAGSYPAFYISGFKPASILRGTFKYGGTNIFTRILLTLQYGISLMAIISGFLFSENAAYQDNYDMGYNMESVVYSYVENDQGYRIFKNACRGIRGLSP